MYKAGFTGGYLDDANRQHWVDLRPRPIAWACWYPASIEAETAELKFGGSSESPTFTQGPIAVDVGIADAQRRWPLVLLSHGTGGTAAGMSWLGTRLARQGFVCIGVDHHGNTANEQYRAEGFICWWERAADLSFILDHLDQIGDIGAHVVRDSATVVGFSLGGYTALSMIGAITSMDLFEAWLASIPYATGGPREFPNLDQEISLLMQGSDRFKASWERQGISYLDRRIESAIAIAPAPPVRAFTLDSLKNLKCPVLIISGEADAEAPFNYCSVWLSQQNSGITLKSAGEAVGHYTFLPECTCFGKSAEPIICKDGVGIDRLLIHDWAASEIERFIAVEQ